MDPALLALVTIGLQALAAARKAGVTDEEIEAVRAQNEQANADFNAGADAKLAEIEAKRKEQGQ